VLRGDLFLPRLKFDWPEVLATRAVLWECEGQRGMTQLQGGHASSHSQQPADRCIGKTRCERGVTSSTIPW
jgi:hypothetical protein